MSTNPCLLDYEPGRNPIVQETDTSQHTSGNKKAEDDANKDAEGQMKEIKAAGSKTGDKVVEDLLKAVFEVKPVVPDRIEVPA